MSSSEPQAHHRIGADRQTQVRKTWPSRGAAARTGDVDAYTFDEAAERAAVRISMPRSRVRCDVARKVAHFADESRSLVVYLPTRRNRRRSCWLRCVNALHAAAPRRSSRSLHHHQQQQIARPAAAPIMREDMRLGVGSKAVRVSVSAHKGLHGITRRASRSRSMLQDCQSPMAMPLFAERNRADAALCVVGSRTGCRRCRSSPDSSAAADRASAGC
jgi:hypothetical protein